MGRDLGALLVRAAAGVPLGLFAALLPLVSLNSALVPLYWWFQPRDEAGALFNVTTWWGALASTLVGLVGLAVWTATPSLALADASLAARLLAPSRDQELRQRVEIEEGRRRSAISAHSAELRRIERDLHDAAQNRLVAVAMFVGMAQRQLATGGDAPTEALDKAHSAATDALAEVRRIIQGIYPPVLTEEGLIPALGLLVDRSQIPTRLHVDRPAPTPAAVDAALYFSIAEALTNVAKHSGATACDVELSWDRADDDVPWVTAVVRDDGSGGADREKGSGLPGIEDRIQALGGRISVLSPPGGPTTIRMSLPCES
jgi:signal transduction histidine kinase